MTPAKVLEVVERYRAFFVARGIGKADYPHDDVLNQTGAALAHCHGMLDKMVVFIHEGWMEKTFRWLGFIQGVLWSHQIYTLEELKNHSRPPEEGSAE